MGGDGDGRNAESAGRSLVAIAMLKVRYDLKHQDYLDYLRPYVEHLLPSKGERVRADMIAAEMTKEFGLRVPIQVIERLLVRLHKKSLLSKVDGVLYVNEVAKDIGLEERRERAVKEISSVVAGFKAHCLEKFEREVSDEESAIALTAFIRRFAVDCLRSFALSSALPAVKATEASDTWVASFINHVAQDGGSSWDEIRTLFKSVLLANAFTCPDPDLATSKFRELTFYFDTPLVLSLLGLHGEYDRRKVIELIKQIKGLEGSCFVFEHTLDEIRAVLKYVETHLDDASQPNRAIKQARQDGRKRSDIVLLSATIEAELKDLGVRIRATPSYDERYQIDENALEGCLDVDIGHINEKALLHDINSVRSVYVLRAGTSANRLEDAKAVLVTTNFKFARAVDEFSKRFEFSRDVSPVVTDFALANICWLKRPAQAEELVTLELLASTEAALSPSFGEWKACLDECEQLRKKGKITADQVVLVRESLVAQEDYVTLTKGAGAEFGAEVALELVRRAEERIAAPLKAQMQGAEARRSEVEMALNMREKGAIEHLRRQSERVDTFADLIANVVSVLVFSLVVWGTWIGVQSTINGVPLLQLAPYNLALGTLVPLTVLVLGWFGWSRKDIHARIRNAVAGKLKRELHIE